MQYPQKKIVDSAEFCLKKIDQLLKPKNMCKAVLETHVIELLFSR